MVRRVLTACVLIVSSATLINAETPILGDLNKDNAVNYKDIDVLSYYWLEEDCVGPDCEGDVDGVPGVNMLDFAILAQQWGEANIVINEFMASNNTFEDPDEEGEYPDWIEIFNPDSEPFDLSGMYLTDNFGNLNKWKIPEGTIIQPKDFLLFWADDDDEQGDFHTNFKLDAAGEEIALVDTNGSTILDSISFENQQTDSSYGRYPDGGQNWYPLKVGTPNLPNIAGISEKPRFSRPSGAFVEPFYLELYPNTDDPNYEILYTLRRRSRMIEYSIFGTILIDESTRVEAIVVEPNMVKSLPENRAYIAIDPALKNFNSNLPIVLIDTYGHNIDEDEWEPDGFRPFRYISAIFIDTNDVGRATITDYPDYAGDAAMHVRGSSSAEYDKKQYRLEIWDSADNDKDVSLLGMPADSDWILFGPYSDKTLMRNEIMYSWNRDMERYGVRCRFVEAFINMDGDGIIEWNNGDYGTGTDYRGVYVLMEKIKRGPDRIDITGIGPGDNSEPDVTGGYIFKKDWIGSLPGETVFHTSIYSDDILYEYPAWDDITTAQKNWINDWFSDYETALFGPDFADPVDGYAQYIDTLSFIDHQILVEVARNVDGYVLSTYLYKDRLGKLNMGPIWDYNGSLGGAYYFQSYLTDGWHFENPEVPNGIPTFEWLEGNLSNTGEQITIANPGDLNNDGERQYIPIDTVEYDDKLPWPTAPDGTGKALTRIEPNSYGNDPANWQSNDPTPGTQAWTVLTYDDFEGGWGNWNDGGTDCYLYTSGTYAHQGSNAIGLQDDSSTSFMTTDNLELSGYSEVKVEFWYYPQSFDSTDEDFWLQISTDGGSNFETVEEWNWGDEFLNDNFYSDSVIISGYTLTSNTKLRFRCDASGDADDVYIDEVRVSAK